jgi:hypothetical protein
VIVLVLSNQPVNVWLDFTVLAVQSMPMAATSPPSLAVRLWTAPVLKATIAQLAALCLLLVLLDVTQIHPVTLNTRIALLVILATIATTRLSWLLLVTAKLDTIVLVQLWLKILSTVRQAISVLWARTARVAHSLLSDVLLVHTTIKLDRVPVSLALLVTIVWSTLPATCRQFVLPATIALNQLRRLSNILALLVLSTV